MDKFIFRFVLELLNESRIIDLTRIWEIWDANPVKVDDDYKDELITFIDNYITSNYQHYTYMEDNREVWEWNVPTRNIVDLVVKISNTGEYKNG